MCMVVLYHQLWASIRHVNYVLKNSLFLSEYQYIWIYVSFHCFIIISIFFFLETNAFFLGFYFLFYMHVFVMVVIDNVLILIVFYLVYTCTWVFFMKKKMSQWNHFTGFFFIVHQLQQSSPTHFIRINYCRSYNLMCCPFYLN